MLEKRPVPAPTSFPDAASLRIGIVHARWNDECIDALVKGTVESLQRTGVKPQNIVLESVPGSWELPIAASRLIAASQIQASIQATDLMGATSLLDSAPSSAGATPTTTTTTAAGAAKKSSPPSSSSAALDAVVAIGVLIKGSTMHFEYISESCCSGLMRVGLDANVPVILGVLTALTEEQARERSGLGSSPKKHNHGLDWGTAAVEMATKTKRWASGKLNEA